MGFSIGRLLGGLAPIVGGIFGGPVGAAIGGAVGSAFLTNGGGGSQVGPTAALFPLGDPPTGVFPRSLTPTSRLTTAREIIKALFEDTGRRVTVKQVKEMVRVCGIPLTAQSLGLTEESVCIVATASVRRRGRGISAADMRRTRSTIRKVHNIQHDLRRLSPAVRRHHK